MVEHLKNANLLPAHYVARDQLEVPTRLHRVAQPLLGRDAEVQHVMDSLLKHHAAVIWGGPGEGKSSIAMEAGCRLWEADRSLGGCFAVDCQGAMRPSNGPALFHGLAMYFSDHPFAVQVEVRQ